MLISDRRKRPQLAEGDVVREALLRTTECRDSVRRFVQPPHARSHAHTRTYRHIHAQASTKPLVASPCSHTPPGRPATLALRSGFRVSAARAPRTMPSLADLRAAGDPEARPAVDAGTAAGGVAALAPPPTARGAPTGDRRQGDCQRAAGAEGRGGVGSAQDTRQPKAMEHE